MKASTIPSLRLLIALSLFALIIIPTFYLDQTSVESQTSCPVPRPLNNYPFIVKWNRNQVVNVVFHTYDFDVEEQEEIYQGLVDWARAGSSSCFFVDFVGYHEDDTPPYQGHTPNTYYIFRDYNGGL